MTEKELIELQEEIEEAKQKVAELKGEKKALLKQLKEKHGCKTVKEATALIKKLQKKSKRLEKEIAEEVKQIEKKYFDHD
jgi:predicted nuclease with TOPRIM domain